MTGVGRVYSVMWCVSRKTIDTFVLMPLSVCPVSRKPGTEVIALF